LEPIKNIIKMALQITNPIKTAAWQKLQKHFQEMNSVLMKELFKADKTRTTKFNFQWNDFVVDYSKNIKKQFLCYKN
jgi:glucose-6-phosphate isomerase